MNAREEILARIRAAEVAPASFEPATHAPRLGNVDTFVDRLADYRAGVRVCDSADLASVLHDVLADAATVVVPRDVPGAWLSGYPGKVIRDGEPRPLTAAELNEPGVSVLTGCAVAIAETGTIVLDTGPVQGRRVLTLVPDHHVCVVQSGQVMRDVPDALAMLADPASPLTFISGPSATSDIELNRVVGVHGPRHLDVVILL